MITFTQTKITKKEIMTELFENYGFTGVLLKNLGAIINCGDDLECFENFIIEHDGIFLTKIQLVRQYTLYLQENFSYSDFSEFEVDYKMVGNKRDSLVNLFKSYISEKTFDKINHLLKNTLTLEEFYDSVLEYRKSFSSSAVVELIEIDFP